MPTLSELTRGALNGLEENDEGLFLMVEGGAIDWAGHANRASRVVEEQIDFNETVEAVVAWVEESSSWDETLVIVTADHETGFLQGPDSNPTWQPLEGEAGELADFSWHTGGHSNTLVPFYAIGAGSEQLAARATGTDPVRGAYLDNTDMGDLVLNEFWTRPVEEESGIDVQAVVPELGDEELPGALVMSIADGSVTLGEPLYAGDRLRLTGHLPQVTVTDTRTDSAGWAVAGQATDLADDERVIRSANLGWAPGLAGSVEGAVPGPVVKPALAGGSGLAAPAALATSDGSAVGTTALGADLSLEIPVDTRSGSYSGSLTVSLFPVD